MSLNESIVEDAALEWFLLRQPPSLCQLRRSRGFGGQVGEQTRYARTLTPALCLRPSPLRSGFHGERETSREVVLVGRLREAIRRLNPAIPEEASATHKESLSVQNTSKGG